MVNAETTLTAEEAKAQIQATEEKLAQARKAAQAVKIPVPTRRQLITQTRLQRMKAREVFTKAKAERIKEVEKAQKEYLEKVEPAKQKIEKYEEEKAEYEKQKAEYEKEYERKKAEYEQKKATYEQQRAEWTQAERIVAAGKAYMAAPKSVFKLKPSLAKKIRQLTGMQIGEIKIYKEGKLVGTREPSLKAYEELTKPELMEFEAAMKAYEKYEEIPQVVVEPELEQVKVEVDKEIIIKKTPIPAKVIKDVISVGPFVRKDIGIKDIVPITTISAAPPPYVFYKPPEWMGEEFKDYGDIFGISFPAKKEIFISEDAKPSTERHELGHIYYPPSILKELPKATREKIEREGRIALVGKYRDLFGLKTDYTKEEYGGEALAMAYRGLTGGKTEELGVRLAMPETVKLIEKGEKEKPTFYKEIRKPKPEWVEKFEEKAGAILGWKLKPEEIPKDVKWKPITTTYLETIGKITTPLIKKVPKEAVVYKYKPITFFPYEKKITKEMLTAQAPKWSVKLLDALIKFQMFSPYMMTGAAKKGKAKVKSKSKSKQELVKKASKEVKERISQDLDDIMERGKTREEVNSNLLRYLKKYRDLARSQGVSKEDIAKNIKSMIEYSQSRDHLFIEMKPATLKQIEATIDIEVPPIMGRLPEVETTVLGAENIFGEIKEVKGLWKPFEDVSKIKDIGIMGKIPTGILGKEIFKREITKAPLKPKTIQQQKTIQRTIQQQLLSQPSLLSQKELQKLKQKQRQGQLLGLSTLLSLRQKTQQRQIQKQRLRERYPRPKPRVPKIPVPLWLAKKKKKIKKEIKPFKKEELVVPYIKRYGKYIAISKPVPLRRAEKIGLKALRQTLGASLQIRRKTGEKLKVGKITKEFRLRKGIDFFTLVQRAPFRLGTREEVSEIIRARRGKFFK